MSVTSGEHMLGVLKRVEALFSAPEEVPLRRNDPKPPGQPAGPCCWIGTENGDVAKLCPPDTDTVTYVDKDGNYVAKSLSSGEVTIIHRPGPMGASNACWLPSGDADRAICGPGATQWMYPRNGFLITEELGPDGRVHVVYQTPLGPLIP